MNSKNAILLCAAGLTLPFLSACATPVRVAADKPVIVTKTVYATVDPRLTAPCAASTPRKQALQTNGTLLGAYTHDSAALDACRAKVDGIRALQQKP